MALAQHLFALAGVIALAWAFALALFVGWLFASRAPSARGRSHRPAAPIAARPSA